MTISEMVRPIDILLVEDNPGDIRLTMEALKEAKVRNRLHCVTDGTQAIEFLRRSGSFAEAPRPDLILLDLNLPGKDGRDVLSEIKVDPELKRIPVVIVTSSEAETDIVRSYNLHANCYISKPIDLNQFVAVVRAIEDFWMTIVRLPSV